MENGIYIIIVLLGLIWWELGKISSKLKNNDPSDSWELRQLRKDLLEQNKNIIDYLSSIEDHLLKIDQNTGTH